MLELPLNSFGQNSHNNQPSHYVQYMFFNVAEDDETLLEECVAPGQHAILKTLIDLYTIEHLAGDEDNGEMMAWFVLSSMGLYDMTPGSEPLTLGIPVFKEIRVNINDNWVDIHRATDCEKLSDAQKLEEGSVFPYDCYANKVEIYWKDGTQEYRTNWKITLAELKNLNKIVFRGGEGSPPIESSAAKLSGALVVVLFSLLKVVSSWL